MSKSTVHNAKGLVNSGNMEFEDAPRSYKNWAKHKNSEKGRFKSNKKRIKETDLYDLDINGVNYMDEVAQIDADLFEMEIMGKF